MITRLGFITGGAFLFGGILGFVPGVIKDGMYLGLFMVNMPHNVLHLASGAAFVIASFVGPRAARLWFQLFGLAYLALAIVGLAVGDGVIFQVISNNRNDAWGHAALAVGMLVIGFGIPRQVAVRNTAS